MTMMYYSVSDTGCLDTKKKRDTDQLISLQCNLKMTNIILKFTNNSEDVLALACSLEYGKAVCTVLLTNLSFIVISKQS